MDHAAGPASRSQVADLAGPQTFPELLAATVQRCPDQMALVVADDSITYSELDRRSARMARSLLAAGVGKGTRLGLLAPDGALWLTTFYAALRIGALVTPISTLVAPPELATILRTGDVQHLIGVRSFVRKDYADLLAAAFADLPDQTPDLRLIGAPYLRTVWLDDTHGISWARPLDDLLAAAYATDAPDGDLLQAVEREVAPGDDAFVVFTSGSTASPKAVVHRQQSVATQPAALAATFRITGSDRLMPLLPAFWMGGIAYALQVLSVGATLVYPRSPELDDVLEAIEEHGVTCVIVWHMFAKLRAAAVERGIDISSVRGLGAPTADEHGERIPTRFRSNPLGMSETFSAHSAEPVDVRLPEDKVGAAGRAVNGIERRVVDLDSGEEVAPGAVGELQVRGGALMSGFYKVRREQVFTPDGYYPTGDLVRLDDDGYAHFVGRAGDMVKTSSANVSRLEVEAAMNGLPDVDLSLVTGVPDDERGEVVVAAVVPAAGTAPTEDSLRAALKDRLSSYKIPRRIVFITHEDVPRTTTGKVQLFELARLVDETVIAGAADPRSAGGDALRSPAIR
ncbi:class I adenylate-forming enzyme family protein [Dermatobacter hominis]|uniref:class I adenylate-forming enzyme family protein n=1 Tax=Dermatobacter hominis TaxID=2884263 RepID=UPI001D117B03|nr:class I adenylate-forming enzyme family protein [Dermatobacter hominis]UDY37643.1 acyl--CoA ligase [Dermatobacter hominis]